MQFNAVSPRRKRALTECIQTTSCKLKSANIFTSKKNLLAAKDQPILQELKLNNTLVYKTPPPPARGSNNKNKKEVTLHQPPWLLSYIRN